MNVVLSSAVQLCAPFPWLQEVPLEPCKGQIYRPLVPLPQCRRSARLQQVLQVGRHHAAHQRQVCLAARDRAAAAPRVLHLQVHRDLRVQALEALCARVHASFTPGTHTQCIIMSTVLCQMCPAFRGVPDRAARHVILTATFWVHQPALNAITCQPA